MSKSFGIYRDLITEGLSFVDGVQTDPRNEQKYIDALPKSIVHFIRNKFGISVTLEPEINHFK